MNVFFLNPLEIFLDMVDFVTSLHAIFGRKLAKLRGSVEDAVFNENANGKHQKTQNEKLYKMAISVFQKFWFLTPKISKNHFFKWTLKFNIFKFFKKPEHMLFSY